MIVIVVIKQNNWSCSTYFVIHQAELKAVVDNQEISTNVSTTELNITTGKVCQLSFLFIDILVEQTVDSVLSLHQILVSSL